jgi:hypothetical protein
MSAIAEAMDALAAAEQAAIVQVTPSAAGTIVRHEVEAQLDAAHRYPRAITTFLHLATSMATISQEVAESCIYSIPRAGKLITGPSVRLAEICASAYGNLQVGARVLDADTQEITAQGVAWDMERNLRCMIEVRRRITDREGRRYTDDMINQTGNAAASIALRNAIFRVVPRAYVDTIYEKARLVAVGDAKTLVVRRDQILARLQKMGVSQERVLARLEKKGVDDIGLEELEVLIGLGTAIRDGNQNIDQAFPAPAPPPAPPEADGRRIKMGKGKKDAQADEAPMRQMGED